MNEQLSLPRHAPATGPRRSSPVRDRRGVPLPTRTPKGVVLRVVRSAMAADWRPFDAAASLLGYVDGNIRLLEVARARVLACVSGSPTVVQARALATLNVALGRARADREEPDDGDGYGDVRDHQ